MICKSDLLFNALVRYISNSYKSLNNHSSFLIEYNITVNHTGLNGCKDSELYENKTRVKCESKTRLASESNSLKTAIHI